MRQRLRDEADRAAYRRRELELLRAVMDERDPPYTHYTACQKPSWWWHVFVDERNETQRMRDRLKEEHAANAIETR